MVYPILITLTVLVGQVAPREVDPDKENQARINDYYASWIGVRAPELDPEALDHHKKPVILSSFLGKRVLLFSFDAGNFNRGVDEKVLFANLRALDKARRTVGLDKLAVVGFSQGDVFVFPGPKPPGELGELTDFPVISAVPTSRRKFNEPYNLLLQPGAILIDRKGVIRAFYDHPMSEPELLDAVKLGDWDKPVRPAPVEDPWSGKGPPKSTHDAAVAWSRDIGGVVGMTSGDWDLRGSNDLILANRGGFFGVGKFIVIDPEDGKERHRFSFKEIHSIMSYTVGWARVGNEKSAVFLTYQGWPREVPIIGKDGAPLWTLGKFANGIDSVAWADLDGSGSKSLIVGCNGGGGLETFVDGRKRWSITPPGNIWSVTGIDAKGGRPGLVIYTDGEEVCVLDAKGAKVSTIARGGQGIMPVVAAELDDAGERQVVAVCPAVVGTIDYAVATDLKGKVLWKFPVDDDAMRDLGTTILAADVTGDGTKEWIISLSNAQLVVLDTKGRLLAHIETTDKPWVAWTAIERKGKPGWIVTADRGKMTAFTLNRKK